jgi:gliding motility-associated-like protein
MTYRWSFGDALDPSIDLAKNGQHTYRLVGPYNVKLIATTVDNCRDSVTEIFDKIFEQPKAGFISPDSICIGTSILLKDTSKIVNGQIIEWYWNLGDNTKSNSDQFNHTFTSSKEFKITHFIKTSIGCHSDTISKIISVWDYPKISAGPDLLVLNDGEKKMESSASGNLIYYKWSPPIYLSTTDILQPYIKMPQEDQIYTLTVTGRGNCISTDQVKMTVLKLPTPTNTFTPNGDGINDTWEIPYLNQYTNCILEIYATGGQILYRSIGYTKNWDGKYNGNDLPTGTYYYVIDPKNGRKKLTGYITILR